MTRLSSPESALQKIDGMYKKLDELYETVDLIKSLNEKFNTSHEEIRQDEERIKTQIEKFGALESEYEKTIARLDDIGNRSESEIEHIVAEFGRERERIDNTVERMLAEGRDVEKIRRDLDEQSGKIRDDIASKTAYFSNLSETAISNCGTLITQAVTEGKDSIEQTASDMKTDIGEFKAGIDESITYRIEKAGEELGAFKEDTHHEVMSAFAGEAENFKTESEARMREMLAEFEGIKNGFQEERALLEDERRDIREKRLELEREMERINAEFDSRTGDFSERLEALFADVEKKMARAVEDGTNIIKEQVNNLSAFVDGSEKEIQEFKGDLNVFKDRLNADLNKELENLYQQHTAFQENSAKELSAKFTDETEQLKAAAKQELENIHTEFNREKVKANETLQFLRAEKKDIEGMRQVLDDEMGQFNRKISGKTAYFTDQLKKLIINSQQKITKSSEEAGLRLDEKLAGFSASIEKSKKAIGQFQNDLVKYKDRMDNALTVKTGELEVRQDGFEKKLAKELNENIAEESKKNREAAETSLTKKMNDYMGRQKVTVDNLIQQIDSFERRVSIVKTESDDATRDRQQKDAKIAAWIEKFAKKQKEYRKVFAEIEKRLHAADSRFGELRESQSKTRLRQEKQNAALPVLEKRVAELEQKLADILQKKSIFSFSKQKQNNPE